MGGHQTSLDNFCMESDAEIHEPGDQWSDENVCNLKVCNQEGKIVIMKCPELPKTVDAECQLIEGDMSKRYPACCSEVKCDWNYTRDERAEARRRYKWDRFLVKYETDYFFDDPELPEGFPYCDPEDYKPLFGIHGL